MGRGGFRQCCCCGSPCAVPARPILPPATPRPTSDCPSPPPAPPCPAAAVSPHHAPPASRAQPNIAQTALPRARQPLPSPPRPVPHRRNSGVAQCFESTKPPPGFASAALPGFEQRRSARPEPQSPAPPHRKRQLTLLCLAISAPSPQTVKK